MNSGFTVWSWVFGLGSSVLILGVGPKTKDQKPKTTRQ